MAFNREKALTAAAKFVAKGQHDRAAKEYVALIEADPTDTRSWLLLAEALTNAGDKPGAIERYLHVAEGYASGNEAQKAIAVYRKVLGLDPNRLDIQTRIASLYKDLGRTGDAVAAYEFVAQAYFQAGQIAEGLEGFRMVAELEPAAVGKRLRLAELYSREGMVAQAVEHFRLAADRLLADRRTDDYIRVAERLIYHKEDDLPVLRSLAQIYLKQGENRRALVKLNALLRAAPADAEGLELLGETFVAIGKVDKAISVVMELAREQRKGGRKNKETAARVLRKALAWNPENADDIRKIAGEIEAEIAALPPDAEPKEGAPGETRDEGMELEVDVVEDAGGADLDIDVDVEEEEERKVEEVPSRPFAPVGANVAPSVVEDGEEDVGDVEKILLEARVYVKYKMFEHALGHLDSVFVRDANHIAGLDLQAQILIELGRKAEAADSLVRLAQLVSDRDPKLARQHLEQAQKLVPEHTKAEMVLAALESGDSGGTGETAPLVRGLQADLKGDPASKPDPEAIAEPVSEPLTDATSDSDAEPDTDAKPDEASSPDLTDAKTGEWRVATSEPSDAAPQTASETKPVAASDAASDKPAAPEATGEQPTAAPASEARPDETADRATPPSESKPDEPAAPTSEGSGARQLPTERTPLPLSPLPTRFSEKTPLPARFSEKTPLPTFKPPPPTDKAAGDADERPPTDLKPPPGEPDVIKDGAPAEATPTAPAGETAEKPAPPRARAVMAKPQRRPPTPATPTPTQPSPEVEELDAGVIEELDVDEVAEELIVETPTPPPPRKGPPSRPKPPAKKPPAAPKARPRTSDDSKSEPAPEDSKASVPEDSKSTAAPEDSKASVPEDSKSAAVPEDSKAPADSKSAAVPEDSKAPADSETKPVPEDSKAAAVPEDSKATADSETTPVPEDSKPAAVPEDSKATAPQAGKPDDTATPGEAGAAPAPADARPADAATTPTKPARDAKPADAKPTRLRKPSDAKPADAKPTDAKPTDTKPTDAKPATDAQPATDATPPTSTTDRPTPPTAETGPAAETTAAAKPTATEPTRSSDPSPGDTAALAIDAVLAAELDTDPEPKSKPVAEWPDISDELDELRFFISSRFEDDAQFAYLDLQRRFPGHPALTEFAERFSTRLESAAAPVMLEDPRTPSAAMRAAAPVKSMFEDEDEDNFLASIFDEPASKAPGKSAKPRRAVATLDDGADAQTFFDLGTAYREMGLEDDALGQFELAAKDPRWTARARIMSASLRVSRGEHEQALRDLDFAIEFATDEDQRSEAGYELGVLYQTLGDKARAIEALETVAPGYRDRDERLKTLTR